MYRHEVEIEKAQDALFGLSMAGVPYEVRATGVWEDEDGDLIFLDHGESKEVSEVWALTVTIENVDGQREVGCRPYKDEGKLIFVIGG